MSATKFYTHTKQLSIYKPLWFGGLHQRRRFIAYSYYFYDNNIAVQMEALMLHVRQIVAANLAPDTDTLAGKFSSDSWTVSYFSFSNDYFHTLSKSPLINPTIYRLMT
jgi:hypothetical protein